MNLTLSIGPLVSLIAGILILVVPRLLNYIVAIYLIVIGLLGLFGAGNFHSNDREADAGSDVALTCRARQAGTNATDARDSACALVHAPAS